MNSARFEKYLICIVITICSMNEKQSEIRIILSYSIPGIISMLLSAALTLTDGYFTGNHVGEDALAAINLGLPILYVFLGVGLCTGVGGSVITGHLIGKGEGRKASEAFTQSMITSLGMSIIASLLFCIFFDPVLSFLRAEGTLQSYFSDYYGIMLFTYPLLVLNTVSGMFLRTDGRPRLYMMISLSGCVLNFLLDYLFVSRLQLGVRGSAFASLFVEAISLVLCINCFQRSSGLKLTPFSFDFAMLRTMLLNGSSEFIGEASSAISMFAFNYVLIKYSGPEGVAAFTILGYSVYAFSMITIGFGQGLCPVVSVLCGKGEMEKARRMRNITMRVLFFIGIIFAAIFFFSGEKFARLFGAGETVSSFVGRGFRIASAAFLIMGFDVIASMYFTAIGDARSSALVSSLRGLILLIPFTLLFPVLWGLDGIWLVTPMTEGLTASVAYYLIRRDRIKQ